MKTKLPKEFKVIHKKKREYLLVFPNDPSIIWAKKSIIDILKLAIRFSRPEIFRKLLTRYGKDVLMDAYKDLSFLKQIGFLKNNNKKPWVKLRYSSNLASNSIWLNLTHRCNLSCSYCYSLDFRNKNIDLHCSDMEWATAKRIIDWAFKINKDNHNNYITFVFFGGEPLLKLDILKRCMEYIKDKRRADKSKIINLSIFTNATLMNRNVAKLLKKYNVLTRITIHQKNREIFDKDMIRKIKMLKSFLHPSRLIINYIIKDIKDIKKILVKVRNLKVAIQTFAFDFNLRDRNLLSPVLKEMKSIMDNVIKDKAGKHLFVHGDLQLEMLLSGIKVIENCGAAQSTISFFPDGSIYPCSGPVGGNVAGPLGNINNGGIDRKIYKNEIKKIKLKSRQKTDCMKCWIRSYCRGVCKYNKMPLSIVKGKNLLCDAHRLFMEYFIRMFADLNVRDILNLMDQRNCRGEDIYKVQEKYEKTKLLFHLRDLRNKRLHYAKLVTPALYES